MTLRLHDTASRSIREFVPITPGRCGIYLCGPTVQSAPHIGHLRSAVNYDVLRRWLTRSGYEVTFVQNVTDIDDKILAKAEDVEWWALAYQNERAFADAYAALGCLPPTIAPRATGHVPEMVELMKRLIERGHAYDAEGDVYFDVQSYAEYGALSGQRLDHMQGDGADDHCKRDPRDFALWKGRKPEEPTTASWPTPWGPGRPGWHLECSAMAGRYLGRAFDIHGGGLDLVFPHHENEIAQSKAAGFGFANYWVHHALLNLGPEKMSKSLGNVIDLPKVLGLVRAIEFRYYIATPHYRSTIDYSEEALLEAAVGFRRIENFVERAVERVGPVDGVPGAAFTAALDDDLGTPAGIASVHEAVRVGNAALAAGDEAGIRSALAEVRGGLEVFGLDPLSTEWAASEAGSADDLRNVVDSLVKVALEQRQAARARKDYGASDGIRDQLKEAGIVVEDTPAGPRWTL
ncbi:cysteine--tRNA ligase [Cryptosporangium arvum]|uniref:Cysteine--tRNA ligase n=1 Tax=Cryptosporangium arvum DSM 44712 TaxID=927661 RepID=A0A010ZLC2_9ACTN|nr:cysteine--tRNA ligase [Cryptosporangium arvum]EXG79464.1 cysteinyl-tRNA synthetase [Cryptosporangium arvum DSM 44712]